MFEYTSCRRYSTSSVGTLLAKKLPDAISSAAKLLANFPDKTELVAKYLSGVAASFPQQVEAAAVEALTSGYLTGWQKAWLIVRVRFQDMLDSCASAHP